MMLYYKLPNAHAIILCRLRAKSNWQTGRGHPIGSASGAVHNTTEVVWF